VIVCALETSGLAGSVALVRFEDAPRAPMASGGAPAGGHLLAEESYAEGLRHGRAVIPSLERALATAGLGKRDVDLFVVGTGPGSFTGLRVGIATGKGLAYALQRPLAGAPSFDALAASLPASSLEGAASLIVAADARRDRLYVGRYDPVTRLRSGDFAVVAAAKVLEGCAGPVVLAGAALERYPDLLAATRFVTAHAPARVLAALGHAAHKASPEKTFHDVNPLYLTSGVAAAEA